MALALTSCSTVAITLVSGELYVGSPTVACAIPTASDGSPITEPGEMVFVWGDTSNDPTSIVPTTGGEVCTGHVFLTPGHFDGQVWFRSTGSGTQQWSTAPVNLTYPIDQTPDPQSFLTGAPLTAASHSWALIYNNRWYSRSFQPYGYSQDALAPFEWRIKDGTGTVIAGATIPGTTWQADFPAAGMYTVEITASRVVHTYDDRRVEVRTTSAMAVIVT